MARDLGLSEAMLRNWTRMANVDEGVHPGIITGEAEQIPVLRMHNRLLERKTMIPLPVWAFSARQLHSK